jgi:hypothetical protein
MSRVIFNIPIFNIQGVDIALILFPRYIIYNMATKMGLGGGLYLSDPSVIPLLRDSLQASKWMAKKEREIIWPLLADLNLMGTARRAEEQVLVSSRATLYVSVHGAYFANAVWMTPGSTSLEIASKPSSYPFCPSRYFARVIF